MYEFDIFLRKTYPLALNHRMRSTNVRK